MIQETGYSLILDEVLPLTIQHEDEVGVFLPRIPPGREEVIGVRISIGIHAAVILFIILLPYFSTFQVGEKPSCVTVSLLSLPGDDSGKGAVHIEKTETTDEIPRQPEEKVIEKPPLAQPHIPKIKEKKEISLSPKTQRKTIPNPPTPTSLNQLTPQSDKNTAEQETEREVQGQMPAGEGQHTMSPGGKPVHNGLDEFSLQQLDQPPSPTRKIEPEFPLMARRLGISGKVVVKFLVKADGNVAKASIVEAEPREIFEQSALEAIRDWQFIPGRFHGEAVATWVILPIQFRLTR
jgi:TonB family protein